MSTSISEQQLVKLCFVLKDGKQVEDASEDMQMAYSSARDHSVEDLISWLDESECLRLRADQLTKKHVFVFEQFSGEAYENIRQSSAVLIGPRCLISCFLDNEAIPLGKYPVLTTAMRNLTVCSSGLKPEEKNEISRMVHHMGGYYLDILTASCTHLVASTVKSIKYEKAAEIKLKIMHPDWVKDVWKQSQQKMISATDSAFAKHALPVFYSLTITSTGLSTQRRNQIKQLIEDNGGTYIGAFKSEITDVLILEKNSAGSAKFQAAIRCKKDCLSAAWIVDSVEAGYALPVGKYEIRGIKSSTPTKDDADQLTTGEFNPDCTQLSMISHMNSRNLTVNESVMSSTVSQAHGKERGRGSTGEDAPVPAKAGKAGQKNQYREVLAQISLSHAKKAGPFLDGCKIYLSGFAADDKEKLNKILNSGGATRFDELSDRISHIIVGDQVQADFREIRAQKLTSHIMTLQWLVRSIELKAPAPEDDDLTFRPNLKDIAEEDVPEPPSPASKKNLQSMNSTFKRPEVPRKLILDDPKPGPSRISHTEDDVLKQYMQKNTSIQLPPAESKKTSTPAAPAPSGSTTQDSEMESQFTEFMFGKTLFIYGFSEEDATQIVSDCENCGGTIVDENYTDMVDYIVIPTCSVGEITFGVKGREMVNCIWLETSIQDGMCYPLEYYFEPILYGEDDLKPLEDEVLVISTYSGAERNYLIALGGILGAKVEDRLVRKTAPIVICKEASGAKYEAAIKWDLTVVNAEWLRECYKQKRRVNEQPFLVGASKASPKNVTEPPPPASTSISRMSDLPEFSKNACLPTTSTDDVDIDSVFVPPAAPDTSAASTSIAAAADPPKENRPGSYKYISVDGANKDTSNVEYAFNRLPSPELKKISYEERLVYSQELQEYGELIQSQLSQRKPFDPGHAVETPPALKHRRLSALTGIHSPATPTSNNSSAGSSEYEQLSITQRVMEFETPIRDTLYKVLKEAEEKERNLSPRTKKMNELLATPSVGNPGHVKTPSLPECMTKQVTPYGFRPDADQQNHLYHKRKLQVWDQFYQPKQQKDRRKSTPLSEIKRRFWKENLGEEYVNYMESKYSSTQFQPFQADEEEPQKQSSAAEAEGECQPSTSKASSSRSKEVFRAINDSNAANESAVVGEKRSRSDDDDDDVDEEDDGQDANKGKTGGEDGGEPSVALRVNNVEDDQVKQLSDLIAMNKNSSKKQKKFKEDTQYTEIPRFDSEMLDAPYAPAVGWCDPTEFDRERRFGGSNANAAAAPQKAAAPGDSDPNRMIHRGTPVFALSGVNDELRTVLMRKIQQLKGEVSTKPNEYDPLCTHILCSKPNRGEKILSGIAAGKWLLCTQYIDDSCKAGRFLNEEQYAWGNPKAKDLPPLEPTEKQVATAAYNWRQKISMEAAKHDGVFTGFRVLLLAPKKQQFVRLIRSGGGHVIEREPPFCDSEMAMMATHCFVDVKKSKISPRDHVALAQAGIAVMNIMYLNAYLTSETLPDPAKYRLEI